MKWGEHSDKAANKITELVGNVFGAKGFSVLLSIVAFSLLAGATVKWTL